MKTNQGKVNTYTQVESHRLNSSYLCIWEHTHTSVTTIEGKGGYEFKREQRRGRYGGAFGGGKEKRRYEVVAFSKNKRNIFEMKGYINTIYL